MASCGSFRKWLASQTYFLSWIHYPYNLVTGGKAWCHKVYSFDRYGSWNISQSARFNMYPFIRLRLLRYPLLSFSLHYDWIFLYQSYIRCICHTLEHIETKIPWVYTSFGRDMGYQPQQSRLRALYLNWTRRGPQNGVGLYKLSPSETNSLPKYFLQ